MKINTTTNIRQYLTEKNESHNKSYKNIPKSIPHNNTLKQKIYYSKNNINKKSNYIKLAKMNSNNNKKIAINFDNTSPKNNIFIDLNDFQKPKTEEKKSLSSNALLDGYKENQNYNENKKIMVKHIPYDIKKYVNISKLPQYDSASFRKAIKYYTLKSDSKTIQEEDLTNYFKPIRNILRIKNIQKKKESQNKNNSNKLIDNKNNGNILKNKEKKNRSINYRTNKNYTQNVYINLLENDKNEINLMEAFNNTNNNINNSYLQNCYFNKNSIQTDRMNKISKFPFNIRINQNKAIKIINKNSKNISDTISYKNNNSKNISDYDTQISINNNANNTNKKGTLIETNSKTLYQFRPRKIHLPKTGINLSSMQYKNKILQNILNKRNKSKN